jgi:hypothetical protein
MQGMALESVNGENFRPERSARDKRGA